MTFLEFVFHPWGGEVPYGWRDRQQRWGRRVKTHPASKAYPIYSLKPIVLSVYLDRVANSVAEALRNCG